MAGDCRRSTHGEVNGRNTGKDITKRAGIPSSLPSFSAVKERKSRWSIATEMKQHRGLTCNAVDADLKRGGRGVANGGAACLFYRKNL